MLGITCPHPRKGFQPASACSAWQRGLYHCPCNCGQSIVFILVCWRGRKCKLTKALLRSTTIIVRQYRAFESLCLCRQTAEKLESGDKNFLSEGRRLLAVSSREIIMILTVCCLPSTFENGLLLVRPGLTSGCPASSTA